MGSSLGGEYFGILARSMPGVFRMALRDAILPSVLFAAGIFTKYLVVGLLKLE